MSAPRRRDRLPLRAALCAGAALLTLDGVTHAQTLALPVPEVSIVSDSRRNEVSWDDISTNLGRATTDLTFFFTRVDTVVTPNSSGGFDTTFVNVPSRSSTGFDPPAPPIQITGQYLLDCDYFLKITKLATGGFDAPHRTPPVDIRVLLRFQLWRNTESIGSPVYEDVLSFRQPGPVALSQSGVGPLGLSIALNDNLDQPQAPLGTIPVTVSGLNTGLARQRNFLVTALAPGGFGPAAPGSLRFRVVGPFVSTSALPIGVFGSDSTMVARSANTPIKVMDGMFVTFGQGTAAPGDTVVWGARHLFPSASKIEANLEVFEGFHVWRSDIPGVETEFTLLGEIGQCGGTRTFTHQDPTADPGDFAQIDIRLFYDAAARRYRIEDHDVHDDFPYRYAISTFDRGFLGNEENITFEGQLATTDKVYPALQTRTTQSKVFVVPNPYKLSAPWEESRGKIVFANLPPACTIRIFTVATDHVDTIEHGPGHALSTSPTTTSWDLVSSAGQRIVPGIYIFHVDSPDGFQQAGKIIVAR